MSTGTNFPYRFDRRWKALFAVLGVGADDGVELTEDGFLVARYGRVRVKTPIANIDHTLVTGPHRWYTSVGLRLSFSDDGITFGTNHQSGLCIAFVDKIPRIIGMRDHSALWVSVADPAALAAAIDSFQRHG